MNIIEKKAYLTSEEKDSIETGLLSGIFPWYFSPNMITDTDKDFFFFHNLYLRSEDPNVEAKENSDHARFFRQIFERFCKDNDIKVNIIYRASINLSIFNGKKESAIHLDHPEFVHRNFILYLTDNKKLGTKIYDEDCETVIHVSKGIKYNAVVFDGYSHSGILPNKPGQLRLVCVFTFN